MYCSVPLCRVDIVNVIHSRVHLVLVIVVRSCHALVTVHVAAVPSVSVMVDTQASAVTVLTE